MPPEQDTYAELQCQTHYSFLRGSSTPQECVQRAAELGLRALAITDWNGVYGLPKAYRASLDLPHFKLIAGARLEVEELGGLHLLVQDRAAYGLLCRVLTQAHADQEKGETRLKQHQLRDFLGESAARGLIALPQIQLPQYLQDQPSSRRRWGIWQELFGKQLYYAYSQLRDGLDLARSSYASSLHKWGRIPAVATNAVTHHVRERKPLQDVVTAIREGVRLTQAGDLLASNAERTLQSPALMRQLFSHAPEALERTLEIAERCQFSLGELRYRYPSEWIPPGHTADSFLRRWVGEGALERYPQGVPEKVRKQLDHELGLIQQMAFADYFLTIAELVQFARSKKILCQGRGSAANSAVCFVLGITAVDPNEMDLLFERFISVERKEPPDIDIDFEHERREEVIQYVYQKYGRDRAAMVATCVTYRERSAVREVTRAFGQEQDVQEFTRALAEQTARGPIDLIQARVQELLGAPRHLSIHSGGFTVSAGRLTDIVPVEPARMEGRTVVQWDKDDLEALGLLKIDLLSLGMLTAVRKALEVIEQQPFQFHTVPQEDAATYAMMQRADTVGTFQIESRAQMAMLPRLKPETFYDLVVEVALVRPGPIVGKMVHPYLKRRQGLEVVDLPHPKLKAILGRTLGVPVFQEQLMRLAIDLAGFTPGEADELRRAIGAWRADGSMTASRVKLIQGLIDHGIPLDFARTLYAQIKGFSEYGFPESHAVSFAKIAYVSAYLKCHYPMEFVLGLLNSQPMGFYAPHTLIDDARRHGVEFAPLDVGSSSWDHQIENGPPRRIRLGLRQVRSLGQAQAEAFIAERTSQAFHGLEDFIRRCGLPRNILMQLALGNALACFGPVPRATLWRVWGLQASVQRHRPDQLAFEFPESPEIPEFVPLQSNQVINHDYRSYGASLVGHPSQAFRHRLGMKTTTAAIKALNDGASVTLAGMSLILQRPPTAKGTVFITLEDETGFLDLIIPDRIAKQMLRWGRPKDRFWWVRGSLQKQAGCVNLQVRQILPVNNVQDDPMSDPTENALG